MSRTKRWTLIVAVLVVIAMITGTLLERRHGSAYALATVYQSPWFIALLLLLLAIGTYAVLKARLYRRIATFGIHAAFALIVIGIVVTTFTARSGSLELKQGVLSNVYQPRDDSHAGGTLPFSVELSDFEIVYYPSTHAPQDFVSRVRFVDTDGTTVDATISMNHIARHHGYRFYQAGFDDEGGAVLTVAYDPWGIGLSYSGYGLLLLSFLAFFTDRKSRFRRLLRGAGIAALLLSLSPAANAKSSTPLPRTLPAEQAERMGELYVLYNDRVCPLQTLAIDFTTKLCGKSSYRGLTAEQVLAGWIFYYNDWSQEPMIKIKGTAARKALGIEGRYASLVDYISPLGQYKLQAPIDSLPFSDPARAKLLAADEKYNLIAMLYGGQLLKIFPLADTTGTLHWYSQRDALPANIEGDEFLFIRRHMHYCQELVAYGQYADLDTLLIKTRRYQERNATGSVGVPPAKAGDVGVPPAKTRSIANIISPTKIKAERLLNRLNYSRLLAMFFITLGLLLFAYAIVRTARHQPMHRPIRISALLLIAMLTAYLLLLFVLRWVVSGHVPMSNGYETMLLLSLCIGLLTLVMQRRQPLSLAAGMLLVGFTLLVAMIGGSNPSVTQLMPVLNSPLLSLHVAIIMLAYALLAFVMLCGVAALVVGRRSSDFMQSTQRISQLLLYPAVFLLAIGIFIGAVWANVSWGTYWSWDPKEVWAMITLLVYALPLHATSFSWLQRPRAYHIYTTVAFLSVLITYFGVNLLLGGMHSYA